MLGGGLLFKPFVSKLGEKLGDKAGAEMSAFYDWLKEHVFSTVKAIRSDRFRFEFVFEYQGAIVFFEVPTKDEAVLLNAADHLEDAYAIAIGLLNKLAESGPDKLVLEFDLGKRIWRPCYLVTRTLGIISDKPTLGALGKIHGLSVGGVIPQPDGDTTLLRK
jgi:hypothetical protein